LVILPLRGLFRAIAMIARPFLAAPRPKKETVYAAGIGKDYKGKKVGTNERK
jgi:hypothetical protein